MSKDAEREIRDIPARKKYPLARDSSRSGMDGKD